MPPTPPPQSKTAPAVAKVVAPGLKKPEKRKRGKGLILYATEGFGKTTMAAYAEESVIMMADGESGYTTLFNADRVPECPQVTLKSWTEVLAQVEAIIADPQGIKLLALDAIGGFERLCHQHICDAQYGGEWGEKGFTGYMRGYDVAIPEWLKLLSALERLRFGDAAVDVLLLGHSKIQPFKNPLGADFDRFNCECHHKTWGVTNKWADDTMFGTFAAVVDKAKPGDKKGKGIGGTQRVVYTKRCDAYDAKTRHGLPEEIAIPNDRTLAWDTIAKLLKGATHDGTV